MINAISKTEWTAERDPSVIAMVAIVINQPLLPPANPTFVITLLAITEMDSTPKDPAKVAFASVWEESITNSVAVLVWSGTKLRNNATILAQWVANFNI